MPLRLSAATPRLLLSGLLICLCLRAAEAAVTYRHCGGDMELNPLTDPPPPQSPDFS